MSPDVAVFMLVVISFTFGVTSTIGAIRLGNKFKDNELGKFILVGLNKEKSKWHIARPGPIYWSWRCLICGEEISGHFTRNLVALFKGEKK